MKLRLLVLCVLTAVGSAVGQKKILDHTVYNEWNSVRNTETSKNGKWVAYQVDPHRGDGTLYWYNTDTKHQNAVERAQNPVFSANSSFLVAGISPGFDTLRTLELEKVKRQNWVKDSMVVVWLESDSIRKFANVASYQVNESNDWMAFLRTENLEKEVEKKRFRLFKKKNKGPEITSEGKQLNLYNPITGADHSFGDVSDYGFGKNGKYFLYTKNLKINGADSSFIFVFDLASEKHLTKSPAFTALGNYGMDYEGNFIAFLASRDTVEENKVFDLYEWDIAQDQLTKLVDTTTQILLGKTVSNFAAPSYSRDGSKLFFGIADIPEQEPEDTLLASEKATLDLWHYKDKQLQPQQLLYKSWEERKTFMVVHHRGDKDAFVLLSNDTLDVRILDHGNSDVALGTSNESYAGTYNWEYPWPSDYYAVDVKTGQTRLLKKKVGYNFGLSPQGKYFLYFDTTGIVIQDLNVGTEKCITCLAPGVNWLEDMNGMPAMAGPIGVTGYTENEEGILLNSEFDVWYYDIEAHTLRRITEGKENKVVYRINQWERDSTYFAADNAYVKAFDKVTKAEGVFTIDSFKEDAKVKEMYFTDHAIVYLHKAEEGNTIVYREMSIKDYPDVKVTKDNFKSTEQVSTANPQQSEYNWATVEQVNWTSYAGDSLNGLLYKPENYDSTKSYPLLVYYYELYSDELHNHYAPRPTASIIFATEYASAGYMVFFPDVRYEEGHPAQSAYDCIMSGTDKILELYPNVDSTRMGLQGQSWGGYQTAQLITMTNRYAAAMAGAPVSNMFSAYGGIRWGSGLNRQFQYEKTQSRIGKTIWEAPELYVENSPIFHLPNVETPVLIMHNDNDGAVPWYQGIEMFVGLKRLGKPVWMLNYNGDGHNLMVNANRMDLSIRMRQFFDYYLLGAPAPEWLVDGIPALDKGVDYKLELEEK
ncbi:Dipeptidyl aminopeptidase/acylaminoacyl peptidase [Lishizhenia tianjinensis]|uniref:Dipeptidyl aminopeptidase/acylaminoacyl peptidase n=1 Tax=Lishizhenia tianjinensis TaxID=477690 RepID=A0A1I7BDW9_9FLAO|nr:prolyl oligopeptidase family serine peptidase [Lishizhenia tianjinensis]SFT85399.1 Dipeptidyl aminopeptidase/acylaminoacyl peptidase [Lishizhenia tianjinensis]